MTKKSKFGGVITALVTPFKDGAIDKASFTKLLRHQLGQGVGGFVINGTTGESPTLKDHEVRTLFQIAKSEVAGQVPLIVGAGLNSTARTCETALEICKWQPDALLVVVPYYNKPPQRGLAQHFVQVARASSVPIVLYNVPSRTVAGLEVETIAELSREKNICGIKEATGSLELLKNMRAKVDAEFLLLSGDDASCVDFVAGGGNGVISVSSHLIAKEMGASFAEIRNDPLAAVKYRETYADLMKWLYIESNPIPVKMALHWMGILDSPEMRLPLVPLAEHHWENFKTCLRQINKI